MAYSHQSMHKEAQEIYVDCLTKQTNCTIRWDPILILMDVSYAKLRVSAVSSSSSLED